MSKRSSNDELLSKVLESHDAAMQELNFLNTVFGFLSRKTKFLQQPNAAAQINSIVTKQIEKAKQKKKGKKDKKEKKEKKDKKSETESEITDSGILGGASVSPTKTMETEGPKSNEVNSFEVSPTQTQNQNETQTETQTQGQDQDQVPTGSNSEIQKKSDPVSMEIDANEGKDDSANEDNDEGEKPIGNGGRTDKYVWTQTLEEVELKLDIPKEKTGKDCVIVFEDNHLKVSLKGESNFLLNGTLHDRVDSEDCSWTLDEEYGKSTKTLTILLHKHKGMNWWSTVIKGDPEIDTKKIEPENSKLDDLDDDVRQTVEKMMFDQRQKAMGKPTSKELEQQQILQRFKAQHPEMDFSNVKFG